MSIEWAEFDLLVVESKLELQKIGIEVMDEWVGKRKELLAKQAEAGQQSQAVEEQDDGARVL